MKIVSTAQMKELEALLINTYGMPEIVLMENAGRSMAEYLVTTSIDFDCEIDDINIVIVAGYGNNGGDGFVLARHLLNRGIKVKIFIPGNNANFSESAKINYEILKHMGASMFHIISERDWYRFQVALNFADIIIDALHGTGLHGKLREDSKKCIKFINESSAYTISVDIPSGLNADTGVVNDICVEPMYTFSLGLPKVGLFLHEGPSVSGTIINLDIGIAPELIATTANFLNCIDLEWAKEHYNLRPLTVHKQECGRVLVIAGSTKYTGAAILASAAALRAGAGIVDIAIPEALYTAVASRSLEQIVHPIADQGMGYFTLESLEPLRELIAQADSVVLGCGLGRHLETLELVRTLCQEITVPLIIDADALFALNINDAMWKNRTAPTIITPHIGEFSRLTGLDKAEIVDNAVELIAQYAEKLHSTIVLKSSTTMVAYPNKTIFISNNGHPGMATAGTGDVLAGVIAATLVQDNIIDPVPMGVMLHSAAAVCRESSGFIASDIIDNLPEVLEELEDEID